MCRGENNRMGGKENRMGASPIPTIGPDINANKELAMKVGKQRIHDLPFNDVTSLGAYAAELQAQAEARGEMLPPAVRLQIGEPSFRTPEHIRHAAVYTIEHEPLTYGPAEEHTSERQSPAPPLCRPPPGRKREY